MVHPSHNCLISVLSVEVIYEAGPRKGRQSGLGEAVGRMGVRVLSMVVMVVVMAGSTQGHELFLGNCPTVPAVQDFDMEKFEGLWYVVESFDRGEVCVTWNITKGEEKGTWYLRERETAGAEAAIGLTGTDFTTATLTPRPGNQARMIVNWPLNFASSYSFTVHTTDYENMAGVFQCQEVFFFQRQKGIVLSRTPLLQVDLRQMGRLQSPGVKVEYYRSVQQSKCGRSQDDIAEGAGSADLGPLAVSVSQEEEEESSESEINEFFMKDQQNM